VSPGQASFHHGLSGTVTGGDNRALISENALLCAITVACACTAESSACSTQARTGDTAPCAASAATPVHAAFDSDNPRITSNRTSR
jgi:hypothetical protein